MSIRIYALAKQLKIESKLLVDVCKNLGLDGKGSPLSSLTDEEIELVTNAVKKAPPAPQSTKSLLADLNNIPMQKPVAAPVSGKIPVLKVNRPSRLSELTRSSQSTGKDTAGTVAEKETTSSGKSGSKDEDASAIAGKKIPSQELVDSPGKVRSSKAKESSVQEPQAVRQTDFVSESGLPDENAGVSAQEKKGGPAGSADIESQSIASDVVSPPAGQVTEDSTSKSAMTAAQIIPEPEGAKSPKTASARNESLEQAGQSETVDVSQEPDSASVVSPQQTVQPVPSQKSNSGVIQESAKQGSPQSKPSVSSSNARPESGNKENRRVLSRKGGSKLSAFLEEKRSGKDRSNRRSQEQETSRPVSPAPQNQFTASLLASALVGQEAMDEMVRPTKLSPPSSDKIVVMGQKKKKKGTDDGDKPGNRIGTSGKQEHSIHLHLAPLPTPVSKPPKKAAKEPAPQKPEIRFSPEAIRAAAQEGNIRPLTEHLREREERQKQKGKGKDKPSRNQENRPEKERDDKKKGGAKKKAGLLDMSMIMQEIPTGKNYRKNEHNRDFDDSGELRPSRRRTLTPESERFRDEDNEPEYRAFPHPVRTRTKTGSSTVPRKGDIVIEIPCTVKHFAEVSGISIAVVIKKLMEFGYMLTLNHTLDQDAVELLIEALELKAVVKKEESLEERFVNAVFEKPDDPESLVLRPPIVTFLGHVDHGKTSLLDRILKLDVVSGEKGGITQHIRAYRIATPGGDVTFVDTPGHEAFTEMRARGANCTDIAVLVVAADDGVMPQTEEAISHAKAAGVPIVVALNKMDLPGVKRDRVIQELAANDLMPSEWGGDVEIVETSALTGMGIDTLMETLLTVAELNELKANPNRKASGIALEASLQQGEGVRCTMLVKNGTLHQGDIILCGNAYGRVKAMTDTLDSKKHLQEAGPSTPVMLLGLDTPPNAGSKFYVLDDISTAREIAEERTKMVRESELEDVQLHVTLENLFDRINTAKTQQVLNIIIRADVRGSIEAIRKELAKLEHPEVKVKILQASVGGITEADVHLADASDAIIVGFSVVPDEGARILAEKKKVQIRRYDIIYKLTEDIKAALEGMLKPIEQVKELGRVLVQKTFSISKIGTIAGCRVLAGVVERDCRVRIIRDSRIIGEYPLETLKREKDEVRDVREGHECGIKLKGYNDIKEGDVFETYKIEEIARTF